MVIGHTAVGVETAQFLTAEGQMARRLPYTGWPNGDG